MVLVVASVLVHVVLVAPVVFVHVVLVARMDGWLRRAAAPSWWTARRPLRMATDCSGIWVPEIAMQMMGQKTGGAVGHMWTCDVFKPAQKWLQGLVGEHTSLADMMERSFDTTSGAFTATDIRGNRHTFRKGCNTDVYVCGFMRAPFTRRGIRQSSNHEDTKTFWASLKTILAVLPRSFVLEKATPFTIATPSRCLTKR